MLLYVVGEAVERNVYLPIPVETLAPRGVQAFQKIVPERVGGEQAVHIGADDVPVGRLCALGPQLAPKNLSTLAVWVHYRGLLVVVLLAVGNLFCMGCPLLVPRAIARRFAKPVRSFPRRLLRLVE